MKLRMNERSAESGVGLSNGVVQVGATVADGAMELGRDEPRLTLHELGVFRPNLKKSLVVRLVENERVNEHNWAHLEAQLAVNRGSRVKSTELKHEKTSILGVGCRYDMIVLY